MPFWPSFPGFSGGSSRCLRAKRCLGNGQLMDFIPAHEFRRGVDRYQGNHKVSSFSCWDQFLSMAFAQLTYRESLRDIETCLRALGRRLYHLGIRGRVSRSTLADANETRDCRIYADLAQALRAIARPLYAGEDFGVELDQTVYALDATIIGLCLSLCPSNLDRPLGLRAPGHRSHTMGAGARPLPHDTNSERHLARENAHFTGLFASQRSIRVGRFSQPTHVV
jgi:hypothetical protein